VAAGCTLSYCLHADTVNGADWLCLMCNVLRMWQCPHPHQRHQQAAAVLFTWKQTAMLCWTAVGRRLQLLPTATQHLPTPALPILTQPVTQTPCLGTYPTPKYTNNFNSRVYTTLVGRVICVFRLFLPIGGIMF
jgi:hypothetical protein